MKRSRRSENNEGESAGLSSGLEVSELKMMNEQLTERMQIMKEQEGREKQRLVRQLNFLEGENAELRGAITAKTEQFFEDKKTWQAMLQQAQRDAASKNIDAHPPTPSSSSSKGQSPTNRASDNMLQQRENTYWAQKLADLEGEITTKAQEYTAMYKEKAECEATCRDLEAKVAALEARVGASDSGGMTLLSHDQRALEARCNDAEKLARKMTRENERLQKKLQNQALLEDEMAQLSTKLKLKESSGTSAHVMEANYEKLLSEKQDWTLLFSSILEGDSEPSAQGADVSPTRVFRWLSNAQKQSMLLLKKHSDQEIALSELQRRATKAEASLADTEADADMAKIAKESAESSLRRQKQQTRLLEGEVSSLRALMKSYNNELSIGAKRNDDGTVSEKIATMKDEHIATLQEELTKSREELAKALSEVEALASTSSSGRPVKLHPDAAATASTPTVGSPQISLRELEASRREAATLRRQIQGMRDELLGLQKATGIDYIPDQVRVVHLRRNPAAVALGKMKAVDDNDTGTGTGTGEDGKTLTTPSALARPMEELRHLREENRRLRDMALRQVDESSGLAADDKSDAIATPSRRLAPTTPAATSAATSATPAAPDSSKLNQRLKEMFRERITCFREAVYLLTGFKIDLFSPDGAASSHPRLKLRSMYAEEAEDNLLFQWRGDALELVETPFVNSMDPRLLSILKGTNSVPAFLSNITLELFEKQTFL